MDSLHALLDTPHLLALAGALGWASGIRLYAVVFMVGIAGHLGFIMLPPGLQVLQQPALLFASGGMLIVEFFADKIPWVDTAWDLLHTVVRIPAGAALAAGALGGDGATATTLAALMGGTLAATAHAAKLTTRAVVNTSPEPFSNAAVSLLEDGLVVAATWLAITHPVWFGIGLAVMLVVSVVLVVVLFRVFRAVLRQAGRFFPGRSAIDRPAVGNGVV